MGYMESIDVNTRYEGGWEAYNGLQGALSIKKTPTGTDVRVEGGTWAGEENTEYWYDLVQAPFSFDSLTRHSHGPSADFNDIDLVTPTIGGDCPYQSFSIFGEGRLGATADELNEIVRTAVGEASTYYAPGEVTKIINIMENMYTHNAGAKKSATSKYTWRTFGRPSGTTKIPGILQEFDAYQLHKDRGPNKLRGSMRNSKLPADSVACQQISEAASYLTSTQIGFLGTGTSRDNVLQNRGKGADSKYLRDLVFLTSIGDTDFYTYQTMQVPRP